MAEFSIDIDPKTARLKVETGDMSGPYHTSADEFMKELEKLLPAVEKKSKRKGLKHHGHTHNHDHASHHHEH